MAPGNPAGAPQALDWSLADPARETSMEERFSVRMASKVLVLFFAAVAVVSFATAWSFRSGYTWTGICLIAVAGPLAVFYWYMLYVNPLRASLVLDDEGLSLEAPPFLEATLPYGAIQRAFVGDLKADPRLQAKEDKRIMRFFGYVSGSCILQGGQEAVILANRSRVVCLEGEGLYVLVGPDGMQRLIETLHKRGIAVAGA